MAKQNRSVLALLAYCLTTTLGAALALAVLVAGATFAVGPSLEASTSNSNNISTAQAFSGMITDSHCGAKHFQGSGKSSAECTRACVRNGAKYMLVDGDAAYLLAGDPAGFDAFAGQRARVTGTLDGDVLTVTAATAP